jgi:hypothetical protein
MSQRSKLSKRSQWMLDAILAELDRIDDRANLVGFVAPLRLPYNINNDERARVLDALTRATARAWKVRAP